jgi:hypothetical protein
MPEPNVTVSLTQDEALVLFEWLAAERWDPTIQHPAERRVLWDLEAQLERVLVAPLRPDYGALLAAARQRVAGAES